MQRNIMRLFDALVIVFIVIVLSACATKTAICKFSGESNCKINFVLPPDAKDVSGYYCQIWITGDDLHDMEIHGNYEGPAGICTVTYNCDEKPVRTLTMPIPKRPKSDGAQIGLKFGR